MVFGTKQYIDSVSRDRDGQGVVHHAAVEAPDNQGVDSGDGAERVGVDGGRLS